MLVSMAAFTANDTCIKLLNATVPLGEMILLRNGLATIYILIFAAIFGGLTWPKNPPMKLMSWRLAGELFSTIFFLSGLVARPIADAVAIGQVTPLAITAAAALILKEPVGWRRWLAAIAGFFGVLLIVRPGTAAFTPAALLILAAVGTVVLRDLATRYIATSVSTLTLTLMSAAAGVAAGVMMLPFESWVWPNAREMGLIMLTALFLTLGYIFVIVAMRNGEVAVVSPFRYAVILFALLSGWVMWNELPDRIQLIGIAILTAAGIYTFHRERKILHQSQRETRANAEVTTE
jgi:drug/metabolite transporter (DMT)-like permease